MGLFSSLFGEKKERRNKAVMIEIHNLIASQQNDTILKHLYYEAAKSFAKEHGALMSPYENDPEDDTLIIDLDINGVKYTICFQRWMKDETMLSVKIKDNHIMTVDELINL